MNASSAGGAGKGLPPHILIPGGTAMEYLPVGGKNRKQADAFLAERWFSTEMVVRGEKIDLTKADGIAALEDGRILGLLTYLVRGGVCEITSLDSLAENRGIGTALIRKAIRIAGECGCRKVVVVTTNDNIRAIRFYQKRGFDMAAFRRNALDVSRKLKPEIPLVGDDGIPLRHEIEFELELSR